MTEEWQGTLVDPPGPVTKEAWEEMEKRMAQQIAGGSKPEVQPNKAIMKFWYETFKKFNLTK